MQVADRRPKNQATGSQWRRAWEFKGPTLEILRQAVAGIEGPILHVCSGPARLGVPGEITVDLHHPAADVRADARHLPFENVGAIVMDPPYGEKVWPLPVRQAVCCEALRALRHGGRFVLHAPWAPRFVTEAALLDVAYRIDGQVHWPHPLVAITVWEKTGRSSRAKHEREARRRAGLPGAPKRTERRPGEMSIQEARV